MSAPWLVATCPDERTAIALGYALLGHGIDPERRGTELYVDTLRHRFAARRIVQLAAPACLPPSILITPESEARS